MLVMIGEQELRLGRDDREQVVEIVRHAAGEAADRLHLLRLAELCLELALLGEIDPRANHRLRFGDDDP